jgi:hypothetical protein
MSFFLHFVSSFSLAIPWFAFIWVRFFCVNLVNLKLKWNNQPVIKSERI